MKRAFVACGLLVLALLGLPATVAGAAPAPGPEVTLYCGDEVIPVSVAGNGRWTPAHALENNLVGVPIAFGEVNGTFTPNEGEPFEFTDPPIAKPNVPNTRNLIVECDFTFVDTFADGTVCLTGTVMLMVPRIHP